MFYLFFIFLIQFRRFSLLVGTNIFSPVLKPLSVFISETFLDPDALHAQFMKHGVKIYLYLLAPAQISVPVDGKSEAATGKMFNIE